MQRNMRLSQPAEIENEYLEVPIRYLTMGAGSAAIVTSIRKEIDYCIRSLTPEQ